MTTYTNPHNLPLVEPATDYIKDSTEPSALAGDLNAISTAANSAIGAEGARAEQAAIADATTKYGGLPSRMNAVETKNASQDTSIQNLRDDVNFNTGKNTQQDGRLSLVEEKNSVQDGRLNSVESKNAEQDVRLDEVEALQPVMSVRRENDEWVWDPAYATRYVLLDHDGKPTVRATPWPVPNPTTPEFTW